MGSSYQPTYLKRPSSTTTTTTTEIRSMMLSPTMPGEATNDGNGCDHCHQYHVVACITL
jgi:hypothetical protein